VNKLFLVFNEHLDALQHGVDGIADTAIFNLLLWNLLWLLSVLISLQIEECGVYNTCLGSWWWRRTVICHIGCVLPKYFCSVMERISKNCISV